MGASPTGHSATVGEPSPSLDVTFSLTCCSQGLHFSSQGEQRTVEQHLMVLAATQLPPLWKVCPAVLEVGARGGCVSRGKALVPHTWLQAPLALCHRGCPSMPCSFPPPGSCSRRAGAAGGSAPTAAGLPAAAAAPAACSVLLQPQPEVEDGGAGARLQLSTRRGSFLLLFQLPR